MKTCLIVCLLLCCILVSPGFAQAAENNTTPDHMIELAKILGIFFILSVIFEVALTPIFNCTIFSLYCEGKGYKTPIKVALALLVSLTYGLNILTDVLKALGQKGNFDEEPAKIAGQILTALLIAGGSDGIYRIFIRLGLRDPEKRKKEAERRREEAQARHNQSTDEGSDADADSGSGEEPAPERPQGEETPITTR